MPSGQSSSSHSNFSRPPKAINQRFARVRGPGKVKVELVEYVRHRLDLLKDIG